MLTSLALIFLVGLSLASIFQILKLPRLVGYLLSGIVLGPFLLNLIDPTILNISAELRRIALVIILIKAGLSLNLADLKKVGLPALLLSFLPAAFEIIGYLIFAPLLFSISLLDALLMGAVLAAVSPAVIVPRMVAMIEENCGTSKQIPQMILAGASVDDVFVLVLFSAFLGMYSGEQITALTFLNIPISILLGLLAGGIVGYLTATLFALCDRHKWHIPPTIQAILLLCISFLLLFLEEVLTGKVALSGILAVMSMATLFALKNGNHLATLKHKFGELWVIAEVLLFVLVGCAVDLPYMFQSGIFPLIMVLLGLLFRSLGVYLCLIPTKLNHKEKLFTIFCYLPKATVQAGIGGVALGMGLACGQLILTVAVIGILLTAPLGAILIDSTKHKLICIDNSFM